MTFLKKNFMKTFHHTKPDRKHDREYNTNPKFSFSLVFGSKFDDRKSKKGKRISKTGEAAGGGEEI